ncbi:hypothetical protein L1887_15216 [Cichorium endivia]|nr:hypothetical protein L1887_15216 [Cichorium endivia]
MVKEIHNQQASAYLSLTPSPPSSCHFLSFPPLLSSNSFRTSLKNPTPFHEKSKNPSKSTPFSLSLTNPFQILIRVSIRL